MTMSEEADSRRNPERPVVGVGVVVWRGDEFLLVRRGKEPNKGQWSIPGGAQHLGETVFAAGEREVREETGIQGNRPVDVGSVGYETDAGNRKVVRWWHMEMVGGKFRPNREVDDIAWLTLDKANSRLQYTNDRKVLIRADALTDDPSYSKIYLVRHAHSGVKSQWKGKDRKRPLDRRGRKQAIDLAVRFRAHPISRIFSSDFQRCVQTAKPLENAIRMPAILDKRLRIGGGADGVLDMIGEIQGESAVMVTHGEIIEPVLKKLRKGGAELEGPKEWKKSSVWVLEAREGAIRSGHYVPPKR